MGRFVRASAFPPPCRSTQPEINQSFWECVDPIAAMSPSCCNQAARRLHHSRCFKCHAPASHRLQSSASPSSRLAAAAAQPGLGFGLKCGELEGGLELGGMKVPGSRCGSGRLGGYSGKGAMFLEAASESQLGLGGSRIVVLGL